MYVIKSWGHEIKPVEVTKKSASSVWIMIDNTERRSSINSSYENYFDTKEQAKEFLINRERRKVEELKESLEEAVANYQKALNINI